MTVGRRTTREVNTAKRGQEVSHHVLIPAPQGADDAASLHARIATLERQTRDLEIALSTAVEHGDAVEAELTAANAYLRDEIAERERAETRLRGLVAAITTQRNDLEVLVQAITEHSDELDYAWVERFAEVENVAHTDALTGIANRRRFSERIEQEWGHARRERTPLSLILFDVDHFKLFNDHYGHVLGDECLRKIAQAAARTIKRSTDLVARYGGEEFVVLLPGTAPAAAREIAELIRKDIHNLGIPHTPSPTSKFVTSSFGVATCRPCKACSPKKLLDCVDGVLYRAKSAGRNRIESMQSSH